MYEIRPDIREGERLIVYNDDTGKSSEVRYYKAHRVVNDNVACIPDGGGNPVTYPLNTIRRIIYIDDL